MDIKTINEIIKLLEDHRDSGLRIDSERLLSGPLGELPKYHLVLAVGHSRAGDKGALSYDGTTSEWTYNQQLAYLIQPYLNDESIKVTVVDHYDGYSYSTANNYLKDLVDPLEADLVLELHFNSYKHPDAHGFEALYWHSSKKGRAAADTLCSNIHKAFPNNLNRGPKGIKQSTRGSRFLKILKAPCVILEPFFGSNKKEWEMFKTKDGQQHLAKAIAIGVQECFSHRPK
jgi:N-acetylmuramoyl-L-alanine amidase